MKVLKKPATIVFAVLLCLCTVLSASVIDAFGMPNTAFASEETTADILDLTGYWTTETTDGTRMVALIDGDEVAIVWDIDDEDYGGQYIYWVGSYTAPEENTDEYAWTSVRDDDQTYGLFSSDDDTVDFHYEDGELSFEGSVFGSSGTVYFYPLEDESIASDEDAESSESGELLLDDNDDRTVTDDFDESSNQVITVNDLSFEVPSSWVPGDSNTDDRMYFYCDGGMLMVEISEYEYDILEGSNSEDFIDGMLNGMENVTDFTSDTLHLDGCNKDVLFCTCLATISDTDLKYYSATGSFANNSLLITFGFCDYLDSDLDHSDDYYSILDSISYDENERSESAEENGSSGDFTEQTLVDNDECAIVVTGIDEDNTWGYTLDVYLENKSDDITYMFAVSNASVNGLSKDPLFVETVAPGKKSNEEISFSSLDEIDEITDIALHFRVYDDDDWMADEVVDETFHIYPIGEENAVKYEREQQAGDIVLVDTDEVTMTVTGFEEDDIWGYTMNVFLENKSDVNLMFSVDDASVNGFMADPFWATSVPAGECAYSSLSWSNSTLEENNIDPSDITEIEMTLRIHDDDNWSAEDIVNETITVNP